MFRLKSVYIKDYKNIQDQTFDFSSNTGYIALIGLNGSGKSNLLEAISIIFNGLFNKKAIPFEYEIKYDIDGHIYERKKLSAKKDGLRVKDEDMQYPSSIIACYSGEDLRLWHIAFESYHMHYFKDAIDGKVIIPKLIYINKYCWDIALISLMSSENVEIKTFLDLHFGITDLEDVEVYFEFAEKDNFKEHQALKWIKRIQKECLDANGKTTMKSLLSYEIPLLPTRTKESSIFYHLYLLSQPKRNTDKGNGIDKYITKIHVNNKGVSLLDFSEGHKKLILIECITQIIGDKHSIVLLDEPDAYVHIENKKAILDVITQYNGQTILTTHSPIFANNFKDSNIFYIDSGALFDKEKADIVSLMANRGIDVVNGACIVSAKYVIIVEGTGDVNFLSKAIEHLLPTNPQYAQFGNVGFIPQGSADHTESFYNDIISKLPPSVEKIIYLFDNDKPGTLNAEKINGKPKVSTILYKPYYDKPFTNTFYIEDYIPTKYYPENFTQTQFDLSTAGDVKYHQLKDVLALANDLKGKATKIKKETQQCIKKMDANDFVHFKPLLDEIINQIATT